MSATAMVPADAMSSESGRRNPIRFRPEICHSPVRPGVRVVGPVQRLRVPALNEVRRGDDQGHLAANDIEYSAAARPSLFFGASDLRCNEGIVAI